MTSIASLSSSRVARASSRAGAGARGTARDARRRGATRARGTAASTREDAEVRHFINLKNGIEALPTLREALGVRGERVGTTRVQSSLLEAGNVERVVAELDSALLMELALGRSCFVWDFGSRDVVKGKGYPRALWHGAEFVRFALRREWFPEGTHAPPVVRGKQVEKDWSTKLSMLSRGTKRKIRYYRQFIPEGVTDVRLIGVYRPTTHDDDAEYYRDLLHAEMLATRESADEDDAYVARNVQVLNEAETIEIIEGLGDFHLFYSGVEEPAWLNQVKR